MRAFTLEHREKLSKSHLGKRGFWNNKKFSKSHIEKLSKSHRGKSNSPKTQFKKGIIPWNKGLKGYASGEKNGMWKGDKVGYYALHAWIKRNKGIPKICSQCSSERNIQWANIDHSYKRKFNDWIELCVPCHRKHDYCLT